MRAYHDDPANLDPEVDGDERVSAAAHAALEGRSHGLRAVLPFLGPAFIACVAYIDPGNFATNIQGGSAFGYRLLWVVLLSSVIAMLIQTLSAKLGIATGKNLAELCRDHFPRPLVYIMWILSEVGAMATDLAEFLGASLGLNLLLHVPLLPATILAGIASYAILMLQRYGVRPIEAVISALVGVIAVSYVIEVFIVPPAWGEAVRGTVTPWVSSGSVLISVGIVGATIMPHVVYLHSALTQQRIVPRSESEAKRIFRLSIPDIVIAMGLAGLVNMAMMYMAASTFHQHHLTGIADIPSAYRTLTPLLGPAASIIFGISLLAAGLSSSTVGTMAGQVIMQGFVGFGIPVWFRRLATMVPAVVIVALHVNATQALVVSQVVLSMVLPLPVVALTYFTQRRDVMGVLVNRRLTTIAAVLCSVLIVTLNLVLLAQTAGVPIPGLS